MLASVSLLLASACILAAATPLKTSRAVEKLNQEAFEEAHQRDDTATRAHSDVQIQTSDGRCLFVDLLSGDFRANLNPIQVAACGSTDGQGWDVITAGKHNDQPGTMLIVSALSQACFNFDPRRAAGDQVNLFSCGGRADGGGQVTNSQLFVFDGGAGPLALQPKNAAGSCLTAKGDVVDVAPCNPNDAAQSFSFGESGAGQGGAEDEINDGADQDLDQDEGEEEEEDEDEDIEGVDDNEDDVASPPSAPVVKPPNGCPR